MNNWINYPTILQGRIVSLIPLEETHFPVLVKLANDQRIWQYYPFDGTDPARILFVFTAALAERNAGTRFPFVIVHKAENKIIGSTSLLDLQPKNLKLEIGSTWLHPDYWATPVNLECKLLLLTHCFEKLNTVRVQLKTDENNVRSRKAIEKIGGQLEGIFRNDMIRDNNTHRNSAYYGIIQEEWPEKKRALTKLYQSKIIGCR
jgi:RimJ/RimL family protein N-acetyltransferase